MPPVYTTQRLNSEASASAATAAGLRKALGGLAPFGTRASPGYGNLTRDPAGPVTLRSGFIHGNNAQTNPDNPDGDHCNGLGSSLGILPASHPLGPRFYFAYAHATTHGGTGGTIDMQYSDDLGLTWSVAATVISAANGVSYVPTFIYWHAATVTLFLGIDVSDPGRSPVRSHCTVKSLDGGLTWDLTLVAAWDPTHTNLWNNGSRPIPLADGSVIMSGYGNVSGATTFYNSTVIRSTDNLATWSHWGTIALGVTNSHKFEEPNMVLLDNGTLLATIRTDPDNGTAEQTTGGGLWTSTSTDLGLTWTTPAIMVRADGTWINGLARPRVIQLTADNAGSPPAGAIIGPLVCMSRSNVFITPFTPGNFYTTSWDRGATWEATAPLDDEALEFAYGDFLELLPGLVATAYAVSYKPPDYMGLAITQTEPRFTYLLDGVARTPLGGIVAQAVTATAASFHGRSLLTRSQAVPPSITANASPTLAEYNSLVNYLVAGGRLPMVPKNLAALGWWAPRFVAATQNDLSSTWVADTKLLRNDGQTAASSLAATSIAGTWTMNGSGVLSNSNNAANNGLIYNVGKFFATYQVDLVPQSNGTPIMVFGCNAAKTTFLEVDVVGAGGFLLKKTVSSVLTTLVSTTHGRPQGSYSTLTVTVTSEPDPTDLETIATTIRCYLYAQGGTPSAANLILTNRLSSGDQTTFKANTYYGFATSGTSPLFQNAAVTLGMADGDPLFKLTDQSGSGNDLVAPASTNFAKYAVQPGFALERPLLYAGGFGGKVILQTSTFANVPQPFVVSGVFHFSQSTGGSHNLAGSIVGQGTYALQRNGFNRLTALADISHSITGPVIARFPYGPIVLTNIVNGASSQLRINGRAIASGNQGTTATQLTQFYLGDSANNVDFYTGELCLLAGNPSTSNLLALERYFGNEFGIPVP